MLLSMKKRARKDDKYTATEVGTLIEQIRSEFKVFGEGLKDLREKVDATHEQVIKNTEQITLLEIAIRETRGEITKINGRLDRIEERLGRIEDSLKSKADQKDFQDLEKKVTSLTR